MGCPHDLPLGLWQAGPNYPRPQVLRPVHSHGPRQHFPLVALLGEPVSVRGMNRAKGVRVRTAKSEREVDADAVLIDAPRSPAYELCHQVGAELVHEPRGFVVRTQEGRIADGVWATGEVVGISFEPKALDAHAALVASQIAS